MDSPKSHWLAMLVMRSVVNNRELTKLMNTICRASAKDNVRSFLNLSNSTVKEDTKVEDNEVADHLKIFQDCVYKSRTDTEKTLDSLSSVQNKSEMCH